MSGLRRTRKSLSIEQKLTTNWPEPDTSGWEKAEKQRYHRFKDAITAYLANGKVADIEKRFSLSISQVQEQIARAMEVDIEGEIIGFCALIRSLQLREQVRASALPQGPRPSAAMCKCGLGHILKIENLYDEFVARVLGKSKQTKLVKVSGMDLQDWLVKELVQRGYKNTEYPFTTKVPLYSSIRRLRRKIKLANMSDDIKANGSPLEVTNLEVMSGKRTPSARSVPFLEVEIDEHKLHAIAHVRIRVDGIEKKIPAERAVGIAICDRSTGAVLGAAVCLNSEAKAAALVEAIRSAVVPGYVVTLPSGTEAPPFRPGDFDPSLSGTNWSITYLDNAKIHLSDDYLLAAKRMGALSCYGPLGSWSGRPNIENVFSRLVRAKYRHLRSSTSSETDPRPGKSPADQAIAADIDHDEICELFYRSLAQINTRVTESALNQTPIDLIHNYFKGPQKPLLRRLPPFSAANPEIGVKAVRVTVRRRSKTNPNLYIAYATHKYTNEILSRRPDLQGEQITIHGASNLRTVQAFDLTGNPLGELTADGIWGRASHTRDIKKAVDRDNGLRYAQHPDNLNPLHKLLQKKAKEVLKRNESRPRGGVVNGALPLLAMMAETETSEMDVTSKRIPVELTKRSLSSSADRARKKQVALQLLKQEKQ